MKSRRFAFAVLVISVCLFSIQSVSASEILLSAAFDSSSEGFVYADDAFRATSRPGYASGDYDPVGGFTGGGLHVVLGGIDNAAVTDGMSGGWSSDFTVTTTGDVTVTLRYRLVHAGDFEPDECGQALAAVDGVLLSPGTNDYLQQFCGQGDGNPDQDSGWRHATMTLTLSAGSHTLTVGGYLTRKTFNNETTTIYIDDVQITGQADTFEIDCTNGIDDDGDGFIDCDDGDCNADPACSGSINLLSAAFDGSSDGFAYADDTFRATGRPGYASGDYDAVGGWLHVALGGIDNAAVTDGMSGGWSSDFTVAAAGQVAITLRYRLVHAGDFEPDECGQALAAVDGVLLGPGADDYLQQFCGQGDGSPDQDSGWQQVTVTAVLSAGTHTLEVGGYLTRKTFNNEITDIYIDDIEINGVPAGFETDCANGVDDDGDGFTDCDDGDCDADPACAAPTTEIDCTNGIDDDGDGLIDCDDGDCDADPACSGSITLLSAGFDSSSEGFVYTDDAFYATSRPGYASGNYDAVGGFTGGGLHVALGGIDNAAVTNGMSGGWSRDFTMGADGLVTVSLRYRLVHAGDFEPDECGQALAAVDNVPLSPGPDDYLEQFCGQGDGSPGQNSGWQQVTMTTLLRAGTHTLTVGGFLSRKTWNNEITDVYIDDVLIIENESSVEIDCTNGIDDDGDGFTDCDDGDCDADPACVTPTTETDCTNGIDDDGDGFTDCDDGDCNADPACSGSINLLSAAFDGSSDGFAYADDTFRATGRPGYASGDYDAVGGWLHVALGGIDNAAVTDGMSGGWSSDFTVAAAGQVAITLRYRLVHAGDFEPDECGQALAAVDGVLLGPGADDYLQQFCGQGDGSPDQDSGWQQVTVTAVLSAGTHTLEVGGYLTRKTFNNEITDIYIDDIEISGVPAGFETDCANGVDDDGDGFTDCDDGDCDADPACSGLNIFLSTAFDSSRDGFVYADDAFYATSRPGYASGDYDAVGGFTGGGLHVALGGIDNAAVTDGMSGGWSRDFTMSADGLVTVSLRYRLVHAGDFEPDECGQALAAVDGVPLSPGVEDYLQQFCGQGDGSPGQNSGWQQVTMTTLLRAGLHTLTVGGYLSRKTWNNEVTDIYFDDIVVASASGPAIFLDDFQDGDASGWTVINDAGVLSAWQVSSGEFIQSVDRVDAWQESFHLGSFAFADRSDILNLSDYHIFVRARSLSDIAGLRDDVGVMVRYRDDNNYVRISVSKMQGFVRLEKKVDGVFTTLAFSGRPPRLGSTIEVQADLVGDHILVYVNQVPVFGAVDPDLAAGGALGSGGLAVYTQSRAAFDDVLISQLDTLPKVVISRPMAYSVAATDDAPGPYPLSVSATAKDVPSGGGVRFVLDGGLPCDDYTEPYDTNQCAPDSGFSDLVAGDHYVDALLIDSTGQPLTGAGTVVDANEGIGVGGKYLVLMGDSILNGVGDDSDDPLLDTQNDSANGKNLNRGIAPVLNDFIADELFLPVTVYNEGLGGTTSQHGFSRLASTVDRHPHSIWLILFGSNDSGASINLPSGSACSEADLLNNEPSCIGTYKYYMRGIILGLKALGKTPVLAKVPFIRNAPQSQLDLVQDYNLVVEQLTAEHALAANPPDFYTYFFDNQTTHFFDNVHPNGIGYASMAGMWFCNLFPGVFSGAAPSFCTTYP